jgi:hypothetical protein
MKRKKKSPERAADVRQYNANNENECLSPLPGLVIFLPFNPGVARCFAALHPRLIWSDRVKC